MAVEPNERLRLLRKHLHRHWQARNAEIDVAHRASERVGVDEQRERGERISDISS
jgi:hypothetical protein